MTTLKDLFPSTLYNSEKHAEICEKIAKYFLKDTKINDYSFRILVNFLFIKSDFAKEITALNELLSRSSFTTKKIVVKPIYLRILDLIPENLPQNIFIEQNKVFNILPTNVFLAAFIKTIFNIIYRRIGKNKNIKKKVVRAWVDVNELMYSEKICNSTILLYPFFLNFNRHFLFVKRCVDLNYDYVFTGIPYSLKKLFKCFVYPQDRLLNYLDFESSAYVRHANELIQKGVSEFYTSDEFEIASFVLASEFKKKNIISVNTAHGVGNYSPYTCYTVFNTINDAQEVFYKKRSPQLKFERRFNFNSPFTTKSQINIESNEKYLVVFIHATMEKAGLKYEAAFQKQVLSSLNKISKFYHHEIDFMIKIHPNTSKSEINKMGLYRGLKLFHSYELLHQYNVEKILFINIFSTLYYEIKDAVKVLFVCDDILDAKVFFGDEIDIIRLDALEQYILEWVG